MPNVRYHNTKCPIARGTHGALIILLLIQCCQTLYWHPILLFVILILLLLEILVIGVILRLVILVLSPRHGAGMHSMTDSISYVWYPGTLGKS